MTGRARFDHGDGTISGPLVVEIEWEELGIFPDSAGWGDRLEQLGLPGWVMNMTLLAIADFLEPVPTFTKDTALNRWKLRHAEENRWTAHRWIFNDYDDEFNFAAVCRILGVNPRVARMRILMLRSEGYSLPGYGRREPKGGCATIGPGQSSPEPEED